MNGRGGSHHLQVNGGLKSSQNPASCQISDLCCLSWTFFNEKNHRRMTWNWSLPTFGTKHLMSIWMFFMGIPNAVFNFRHLFFDKLWVSAPPSQDRMVVNEGLCRDSLLNIEYSWWSLLRGHTQDKQKKLWQTKHNTGIHPFAHWIFFIKTDDWCFPVWTLKWPWVEAIDFPQKTPFQNTHPFCVFFFRNILGAFWISFQQHVEVYNADM